MKKNKTKKKSPLVIGMTVGLIIGIAVVVAITWYLGSIERLADDDAQSSTELVITEAPAEQNTGFSLQEGPPPGQDTPYKGRLVAYSRWIDVDGAHVVILATTGSATAGDKPIVEALHYLKESSAYTLVSQRVETIPPTMPGSVAWFYRDMLWVRDIDNDGRGEAFVVYVIDESMEPGPKRLELLTFYGQKQLTLSGTTRYDPSEAQRIPASMYLDDGMAEAPPALRTEALALWADAQFDLAEPPAFPGFYDFRHFDGAVFKGDEPFWNLSILPQYALFKYSGDSGTSTIKYESLRSDGPNLVIECTGQVEAWKHSFRITIEPKPIVAPHGEAFDYAVTIDWSDGTQLRGWGDLAKQDAP